MDGMTLERLQVIIDATTKPFRDELAKVKEQTQRASNAVSKQTGKMSSAFKKIGKVVAVAFAVTALISFGKSCTKLASDLQEVQNVVDVTFTNMSGSVDNFAKNAITQFGLSETAAKKYVGMYGTMAKQFGFTENAAYDMSTGLAGAAGDVASFYNMTADEAYTKLKSVFSGETETLKDIGVVMTQNALDAYAMANGFGKTTAKMTEQEKVALRYQFVMKQLSASSGDFARTSDSWANQTRILSLRFDSLKATIGQGLINVFAPVLKLVNALIGKLQVAAAVFSQFTTSIFGNAGSSNKSPVSALVSETQNLSESTKEAAKAQNELLGFDQITKVGDQGGGSSDSSAGTPVASMGVDMSGIDNGSESVNRFSGISEKLKNILKPVGDALGRLKDAFEPFKDNVGQGLQWFYNNVLLPIGTFTIGTIVPGFLDLLSASINVLNPLLTALAPLALWLWDNFLQPIAKWTGGVIITVLKGVSSALNSIGGWIKNNQKAVSIITIAVGAFFLAWKATELLAFIQMSGGIVGALTLMTTKIWACTGAKIADKLETVAINALYAKDFIVNMAKSTAALVTQAAQWVINTGLKVADTVATTAMTVATTAWNVVCGIASVVTTAFGAAMAFLTSPIGLVVLAIAAIIAIVVLLIQNWDTVKEVAINVFTAIKDFIASACTSIGNFFKGMWAGIKNVFSAVGGFFTNAFTSAFNGVKTAFSTVGSFFASIWTGIKNTFSGVANWFGNIFSTAWKKVKDVFSVGGKIFDGIKDGILSALKAVINGLIGGINTVIAIPFDGINWALKKLKGISIMGIEPFGWVKTFDVPEIPKLARGGIVDGATIAMIGEAGKEAVMPLENNTGWITQLAGKLNNQMDRTTGTSKTSINMPIYIGGEKLTTIIIDDINKITNSTGECPIYI